VLQLTHEEPAVKHGILALSCLHERLESGRATTTSSPTTDGSIPRDAALVQYIRAVRYSNELLSSFQEDGNGGDRSKNGFVIEKTLILCIIFTCFENLSGNYRAANMHLRNGLRILHQYCLPSPSGSSDSSTTSQTSIQYAIAKVLHRFDFQTMIFSDDTSPYEWWLDTAPEIPAISSPEDGYENNEAARDDLVELSRCLLWTSGNLDKEPRVTGKKDFRKMYEGAIRALVVWQHKFGLFDKKYRKGTERDTGREKEDEGKATDGGTLLRIYAIMMRAIVAAGAGLTSEMVWDAYIGDFREAVELAETLPMLQPQPQPPALPSPPTSPPLPHLTITFHSNTAYPVSNHTSYPHSFTSRLAPQIISPSFELSPMVPLFLIATRCRDPLVRRRALVLLLNYRRREGVWDSLAAGMIAAQVLKQEEGILDAELSEGNWLSMGRVEKADDITEERRLGNLLVRVEMKDGGAGDIQVSCSVL